MNNQQKKAWTKSLQEILDKEKQSIEANNYEHPAGTLATTFHKPAGGANLYVRLGYVPHKIFNHTRGQVSGPMNADPINANKQVNNQKYKYDN